MATSPVTFWRNALERRLCLSRPRPAANGDPVIAGCLIGDRLQIKDGVAQPASATSVPMVPLFRGGSSSPAAPTARGDPPAVGIGDPDELREMSALNPAILLPESMQPA